MVLGRPRTREVSEGEVVRISTEYGGTGPETVVDIARRRFRHEPFCTNCAQRVKTVYENAQCRYQRDIGAGGANRRVTAHANIGEVKG